MVTVEPLAKRGPPSASERMERADKLDDVKFRGADEMGGGNSADYLAARIKRDRPDIAEAVMRHEYRSIYQAALSAGLIRKPDTLEKLLRLWFSADQETRDAFDSLREDPDAELHFSRRGPRHATLAQGAPDQLKAALQRMTAADVARACGVSRETVRRWCAGSSKPRQAALDKLNALTHQG